MSGKSGAMFGISALAIVVLATVSILVVYPALFFYTVEPQCNTSLDNQPRMKVPATLHTRAATFVTAWQTRYDIWDVREQSNVLAYMVAANPQNGSVSRQATTISRAFSVRFVCEMARTVYALSKDKDVFTTLSSSVDRAMTITSLSSTANSQLKDFKSMLTGKAATAVTVVDLITSTSTQAKQMIDNRTDVAAEAFLEALVKATIITAAKYSLVLSIAVKAADVIQTQSDSWLGQFYDHIQGNLPILEAMASTYGQFEASRTVQNIDFTASSASTSFETLRVIEVEVN